MSTLIVIFTSILVSATTINHDAQPGRSKAFIDNGCRSNEPHLPLSIFDRAAVLVDSACPYSAWTQAQECLSYSPFNDGLQFVCRSHYTFGLNVHQTTGTFSFWIYDQPYYQNMARYPSSCATSGPHICYPALENLNWGIMSAQYESGGWWSSFWDTNVSFGDLNVHKVIGKQLSNGNMLFIGYTDTDMIKYCTTSPNLQTVID